MSVISDYPNPYENTAYDDYPDPYRVNQTSTYNDNSNYRDENLKDSGYSDYNADYYQENRYTNEDSGSNKSSEQDERERDRMNRRNRSERRRDLRRDDRRDDRDRYHSDRESSRSRDRNRDRDVRDSDRYERERERDRRDRDIDDRAGEKWLTDTPTNTIILRGLPQTIEEKDIRAELMLFGAPVKDVRLMRKSTGASRGFAFVEFHNVDDALRWMDTNQQRLTLQNQYQASMNFSSPKDPNYKQLVHKMDWTCVKCGVHNFKRRDYCFKCNMSRYESGKAQAEGFDHIGTNPCNTLLFRGLDALTTEENLLQALNAAAQMTCKNMKVIKDQATSVSMGFAFVELSSVAESMNVLEVLKALSPPFEVDGKQILVSFAKNTFNTSIATIAAAAAQPKTWDQSSEFYQGYEYNQQGGYYYDGQYSEYSSYYSSDGATATTSTTTDSTNAAAAVAQAAIQQAQAAKHYQKQVQHQQKISEMSKEEQLVHQATEWKEQKSQSEETVTKSEVTKYPAPDVSLYQYDETSGYYYDPVTTLYYDANSQYYYNGQTGQFLYWDAEQSTYLPAPTSPEDGNCIAGLNGRMDGKEDKKETKEKKEKVKVAKKIAMDMEKWAKSMNAQKEALRDGIRKINMPNLSGRKESATADAGFAILEKSKTVGPEDKSLMPPPQMPGVESSSPSIQKASPGLVASYGGDSDDDDEEQESGRLDDKQLMDLTKMACLLCKRQFQSKDQLMRHTQMSDLHKQNLEKLRKNSPGSSPSLQYRDRAKERREKIGSTAPPAKKRPASDDSFEQPTKAGIGNDNIGSKMLQKMGWSSGQGLGKTGQGIVNPIQAERRSMSAGLGMRGASYNVEDTDNYKDALRKTMFARYNELD